MKTKVEENCFETPKKRAPAQDSVKKCGRMRGSVFLSNCKMSSVSVFIAAYYTALRVLLLGKCYAKRLQNIPWLTCQEDML